MRYTCPSCQGQFQISLDKLPDSGKFKLTCPTCQKAQVLDKTALEAMETPSQASAVQGAKASAEPDHKGQTVQEEPETVAPGTPTALILVEDSEWLEAARSYLEDRGWFLSLPDTEAQAVARLGLNHYDLVLADETQKALRREIEAWPGNRRRETNLILLSPGGTSLDPRQGFLASANACLDPGDLDRAQDLLRHGLDAFSEYYAPLKASEEKVAQAKE